jgi:hypothetical protein
MFWGWQTCAVSGRAYMSERAKRLLRLVSAHELVSLLCSREPVLVGGYMLTRAEHRGKVARLSKGQK